MKQNRKKIEKRQERGRRKEERKNLEISHNFYIVGFRDSLWKEKSCLERVTFKTAIGDQSPEMRLSLYTCLSQIKRKLEILDQCMVLGN